MAVEIILWPNLYRTPEYQLDGASDWPNQPGSSLANQIGRMKTDMKFADNLRWQSHNDDLNAL